MYVGFLLGWLRVPDQPYPPPCPGADAHRPILSPHICSLLHSLLPGHHPLHADLFCWFPGKMKMDYLMSRQLFWVLCLGSQDIFRQCPEKKRGEKKKPEL